MEFKTDIFQLSKPTSVTFSFPNVKLPTSNDLYFRSKQTELIEQYAAARIFLQETETTDWNHWFNPVDDKRNETVFRLIFKSHFYETALFIITPSLIYHGFFAMSRLNMLATKEVPV
mgnify:CR=1 FL=1